MKIKPLIIILITLAVVLLIWFSLTSNETALRRPLNTSNQPTIGNPNAPVQVVVFEEPKCPGCKQFTLQIYPKIREEFIDTNVVIYTVIPVSFLPNSMQAAEAWLCVYHQNATSETPLAFHYI
ncbi:MAG: thioredoxin domain-containing protein, partial [Parachlamydiaceae bacterium]|nr:thioredoxin domain-containing protein [Parachlamydiaceae bacterium]